MKIIHTADIHLDSPLSTHLGGDKNKIRKNELLESFKNLVGFAKDNGVSAIIIAGDLFDANKISLKTKSFVFNLIESHKDIKFFYVSGNHDENLKIMDDQNVPENLIVFSNEINTYRLDGNITISGVQLSKEDDRFYNKINLNSEDINIFVLHGNIFGSKQEEEYINLKMLQNKNINYLALGHIHSFQAGKLDDGGIYTYSGCLEGRGFDETGDKGFVMLEINNNKIKHSFVKNSLRTLHKPEVNMTNLETHLSQEQAISKALKSVPSKDLVEIILTGNVNLNQSFDLLHLQSVFEKQFFFVKITNNTKLNIVASDYENDISLKGEFVREVLASSLDDLKKEQVIKAGISALLGEEV